MADEWYDRIGIALGAIAMVVVFIGAWIYCVMTYGFLLGVGLGWLPAGICSGLAFAAFRYLWGLLVLGGAFLVLAQLG